MTETTISPHQIISPYISTPSSTLHLSSSSSTSPSVLDSFNNIIKPDADSTTILTSHNTTSTTTANNMAATTTSPETASLNNPLLELNSSSVATTSDAASKKRPLTATAKSGGSGGPPRKRTTRACDQCNHLRTKCDGKNPCAHCTELNLECGYLRVPLKRGKASKTYIESAKEKKAALAAAMAVATAAKANGEPVPPDVISLLSKQKNNKAAASAVAALSGALKPQKKDSIAGKNSSRKASNPALHQAAKKRSTSTPSGQDSATKISSAPVDTEFNDNTNDQPLPSLFSSNKTNNSASKVTNDTIVMANRDNNNSNNDDYNDKPRHGEFGIDSQSMFFEEAVSPNTSWLLNLVSSSLDTHPIKPTFPELKIESNLAPSFINRSYSDSVNTTATTPGNISTTNHSSTLITALTNDFRYQPTQSQADSNSQNQLLGHPQQQHLQINNNANKQWVSTPVESSMRFPILKTIEHMIGRLPMSFVEHLLESYFSYSTHLLAHIVRKSSILSPTNPRKSSPALLFSCLLVAAHYSDNPLVSGSPSARENVIRRLTDLTISNLTTAHQVTPAAIIDDVIAYIHLGTMVSASEYKGLSLRFWSTAWALSKELKLGIECPELPEEAREERRRTWWLLYIVDRHLGLCYNRPLAMLDSESTSLYRPLDDVIWLSDQELTPAELDPTRVKGLCHYVTGQSLFGYFLPLMTILGSVLELHHLQQNPILPHDEINQVMRSSIKNHLNQYTDSLKNWNTVPCVNIYENAWRDYAYQISHVVHILSLISWDPLELLNSMDDTLLLSPEFREATDHAISAAKHTRRILAMDADLMLMPFFFGVYLLQSSFLLLFLVDRVESKVPQDVIVACETVVHAHEVCVVTLNTEYQRNFRRVMRGTINILNLYRDSIFSDDNSGPGGGTDDDGPSGGLIDSSSKSPNLSPPMGMTDLANNQIYTAQKQKQKELARKRRNDVLGLYRWSSGGYGLAV